MNQMYDHSSEHNPDRLRSAISAGAYIGMKTGCLLSVIYSMLGVVFILTLLRVSQIAPYAIIGAWPFYMLILLPVLPLGAITGSILGWLSRKLYGIVPQQKFFIVGIFVCILLLAILHVGFFTFYAMIINKDGHFTDPFDPLLTYLIFIGIPSILYIAAGGWVSQRLVLEI